MLNALDALHHSLRCLRASFTLRACGVVALSFMCSRTVHLTRLQPAGIITPLGRSVHSARVVPPLRASCIRGLCVSHGAVSSTYGAAGVLDALDGSASLAHAADMLCACGAVALSFMCFDGYASHTVQSAWLVTSACSLCSRAPHHSLTPPACFCRAACLWRRRFELHTFKAVRPAPCSQLGG